MVVVGFVRLAATLWMGVCGRPAGHAYRHLVGMRGTAVGSVARGVWVLGPQFLVVD